MNARVHEACRECGRPIRRWSEKPADFPEGVKYGAHGRCDNCYQRTRRGTVDVDPGPSSFRRNRHVELVRWILTRDGAEPELISGTYLGRRPDVWILNIGGRRVELPRTEWLGCVA